MDYPSKLVSLDESWFHIRSSFGTNCEFYERGLTKKGTKVFDLMTQIDDLLKDLELIDLLNELKELSSKTTEQDIRNASLATKSKLQACLALLQVIPAICPTPPKWDSQPHYIVGEWPETELHEIE